MRVELAIVGRFVADDDEHAVDQFLDMVLGDNPRLKYDEEARDELASAINVIHDIED